MAEPSSTTLAIVTTISITMASLFSGVDAPTLIGATAGASLFVMSARDLCILTRIIYLIIALCMGYLAGPAMLGNVFGDPAVSAFVLSASTIGLGLKLINWIDTVDINHWIKRGKP